MQHHRAQQEILRPCHAPCSTRENSCILTICTSFLARISSLVSCADTSWQSIDKTARQQTRAQPCRSQLGYIDDQRRNGCRTCSVQRYLGDVSVCLCPRVTTVGLQSHNEQHRLHHKHIIWLYTKCRVRKRSGMHGQLQREGHARYPMQAHMQSSHMQSSPHHATIHGVHRHSRDRFFMLPQAESTKGNCPKTTIQDLMERINGEGPAWDCWVAVAERRRSSNLTAEPHGAHMRALCARWHGMSTHSLQCSHFTLR